jgi:hypothetical protein
MIHPLPNRRQRIDFIQPAESENLRRHDVVQGRYDYGDRPPVLAPAIQPLQAV